MRLLRPVATDGDMTQLSPIVWCCGDAEGAFVFDATEIARPFVGFFLQAGDRAAPKISFDAGEGFNELSAIVFRAFPFGFYHISLATIGSARRIRFRVCEDGPASFRFLAFDCGQPLLVAVLHFLFNLRYQKIGLVAPASGGQRGGWASVVSNVKRIRTFFSTVSAGGGIRVQQAEDDVLARLRLAQTLQAQPIQASMAARMADRGRPLLSFVAPVYETRPDFLRDLVGSFTAEEAAYAELLLVDDGSRGAATRETLAAFAATPGVRVVTQAENGGIARATNAGIAAARGEWLSFIDHDDAFVPGAIAVIAQAIADHADAIFFYTDEIVTNAALKPAGSFCKPAYDSVLLSGLNYINHFSVFRRDRVVALGGLRLDREGSQDYDMLLRYLEGAAPGRVIHVPFLAYTWRRGEESYSALFRERSVDNARAALRAAYADVGHRVVVEPAPGSPDVHRVRFSDAPRPLVSVIIPNRDSLALITRVVDDLLRRTAYPAIEIVIADNGSSDPAVLAFYQAQWSRTFLVDLVVEPFNFARMCNRGARLARGEVLLFLNNDIEVIEPDWLDEMVECLAFPQTGIVGARLLYPDGSLQHAGVIVGLGEAAGHWYVAEKVDEPGPMGRLAVRQTIGAVTGACMVVTRACFDALNGFDEVAFPIAYNDIDFCIRARHAGFRTIWTPFATLTHHESASRGSDAEGENATRFRVEFGRLQERHATKTIIDEAYSPFYDRRYSRPHLMLPDALPAARRGSFG